MRKYIFLCAGLCLAMVMTGCKSSESAYKKAYEKAKAQEATQQQKDDETPVVTETPTVVPVQTRPSTQTTVVDNFDNTPVRSENVSVVSGDGLRAYSVVVGSFTVIANAEGLMNRLKNAGYAAQIAKNERGFYRVIAGTFDNKADAASARNAIMGTQFNPDRDAWILSK